MTRIVLIRHGESRCNFNRIVGGHAGCTGLTDSGRSQATALLERLSRTGELDEATALYSSELERAFETASIIAPRVGCGDLEVVRRCSLCELHPGEGDGLDWDEFNERYGKPDWDGRPDKPLSPGGETWGGFVLRVTEALQLLADRHRGELVVVACHGGVVDSSMATFLDLPRRHRPSGFFPSYTSMTEWGIEEGKWRLIRYNDVAHLGGPFVAEKDRPHTISARSDQSAQQA
jgi:broad specificity phosphatase PhoE